MGPLDKQAVAHYMTTGPEAAEITAVADQVLGYPLLERFQETEGDYSEAGQLTFMAACLALAAWAGKKHGRQPDFCVGPSFGGRVAAVHSGALPLDDGLWLAAELARLTAEYFGEEHTDIVTHSFVRVPEPALAEVLAGLADAGEWYDLACVIDHDFYMLTLHEAAVEPLQARLRALGGLPLYTMRPPMHSPAFAALRDRVEKAVSGLFFADPHTPVVSDHDGKVLTTGAEVKDLVLDGFVRSVNWPDAVSTLVRSGVRDAIVCGPDALFGRVGVTRKNLTVTPATPQVAAQAAARGG
ncbi:ACP S-malonyltransferase [Murinocardiopsis flavida]|nr:ACP S-malonyltransferase [Murinocardiopsis flavida]